MDWMVLFENNLTTIPSKNNEDQTYSRGCRTFNLDRVVCSTQLPQIDSEVKHNYACARFVKMCSFYFYVK